MRPLGKDGLTLASTITGENDEVIGALSQEDVTLTNVVKNGEVLELTDLIANYGRITHTERFSDIDDIHMLLKAAESLLTAPTL